MSTKFEEWRAEAIRLAPPPFTDFRLHAIPKFIWPHLSNWAKTHHLLNRGGYSRAYHRQQLIKAGVGHAMDHWGAATARDGQPALVLQPYGTSLLTFVHCEVWANSVGLHCYVSAASEWYPGRTLTIMFTEQPYYPG
jgi:hypothetical protein